MISIKQCEITVLITVLTLVAKQCHPLDTKQKCRPILYYFMSYLLIFVDLIQFMSWMLNTGFSTHGLQIFCSHRIKQLFVRTCYLNYRHKHNGSEICKLCECCVFQFCRNLLSFLPSSAYADSVWASLEVTFIWYDSTISHRWPNH